MIEPAPVIGPRILPPDDSPVRVWLDTGSGPGQEILVRAGDLSLAPDDDGQSVQAVYRLPFFYCGG